MDSKPYLLPLPPRLLHHYQIKLLADRGTRVWTTWPELSCSHALARSQIRDLLFATPNPLSHHSPRRYIYYQVINTLCNMHWNCFTMLYKQWILEPMALDPSLYLALGRGSFFTTDADRKVEQLKKCGDNVRHVVPCTVPVMVCYICS